MRNTASNTEIFQFITECVRWFGSADAALKAAQDAPTPRKKRRAKKLFKKLLRTYKYHFENRRT